MNVTEAVAQFIIETKPEDIPEEAFKTSQRQIMDTLGVALLGSLEPVGKIVTKYTKDIGGTPEAGVIGSGFRTSAPNAAFANGTMAHALDYDDSWMLKVNPSHPSCAVVPVVMALGEKLRASGTDVVTAFLLGLEVHGKLGLAGNNEARYGFHSSATLGTMAATTAAARLLKLDVKETVTALGIAGSEVCGMGKNVGTMTKPFHAGNAARGGVVAAILAKEGFTADSDILSGQHNFGELFLHGWSVEPEKMVSGLGNPFHVLSPGAGVKLYPSCYMHARPLDATLQLVKEHNISYDDVEYAELTIDPALIRRSDPQPDTSLRAKFSLEYNVAAAILDGKVNLETFAEAKVLSPGMQEALSKVKIKIDPAIPTDYDRSYNIVTIKLRKGEQYSKRIDQPHGSWWDPASTEELITKYRDNARFVLSNEQIERSLDLILNLWQVKDVTELAAIMTTPALTRAGR